MHWNRYALLARSAAPLLPDVPTWRRKTRWNHITIAANCPVSMCWYECHELPYRLSIANSQADTGAGFSSVSDSDWVGNNVGSYNADEWSSSSEGCTKQCENSEMKPQCALPRSCGQGIKVISPFACLLCACEPVFSTGLASLRVSASGLPNEYVQ